MPNVVKGSKQQRMVVVPHRPWRLPLMAALMLLLMAGGALLGNWYGNREGLITQQQVGTELGRLGELEQENAVLRRELAMLDRSSVMDQQTSDVIQTTILDLREYIDELEKDVQFYRHAMTKDIENVGLSVGPMDIQATEQPDRYGYKLVMRQQESSANSYLTGHVNVEVVGTFGQEQAAIPLFELADAEEQADIKLRFRYFQNIEGVLELPPEFAPERIEVTGVATAPLAKTVKRSFDWVVEGDKPEGSEGN